MSTLLGVGLALVGALFIAIQVACIRVGTDAGRSNDALVVVLLVNIVVLVPLAGLVHFPTYHLPVVAVLAFAGAGFVGTMLGRAFEYAGIERIGASRSEPIKASQPLHAALLAVFLLGESLSVARLAGIVCIVAGIALISWESQSGAGVDAENPLKGLLFPFAAAFFFGIEPIFAKVGFAAGTPVLVGLAVKTLAATVAFTAFLRSRGSLPSLATVDRSSLRWYVAAGVANTLFLLAYYAALEIAPVVLVIPVLQASPLFVIAISLVFLERLERITPRLVLGALVVVAGTVVVSAAV